MRSLIKSPFISATLSGITALIADFTWLTGELLHSSNIISEHSYLMLRVFGVIGLFLIALGLAVYAVRRYLTNGYVSKEVLDEKAYHCKLLADKKRNKIFK